MGRAPVNLISSARRNRVIGFHVCMTPVIRDAPYALSKTCAIDPLALLYRQLTYSDESILPAIQLFPLAFWQSPAKQRHTNGSKKSEDHGYGFSHITMPTLRCNSVTGPDR